MNNSPFPPELRTMSIVPRWGIIFVTQKDTVANHSYFVSVYSHMISSVIRWKGPRDYLFMAALTHDLGEIITGDLIGPTKAHILDYDKYDNYMDHKINERAGGIAIELAELSKNMNTNELDEADAIIKAADRLDALLFLIMEERRGNTVISALVKDAYNKLESAWRDLPAERSVLDMTWQTVAIPAIEAHKTQGGRGL